jgi:DNA-binding winged helix-turn-helix (wHTH) protein/Tfp pilus assembly protein PilF
MISTPFHIADFNIEPACDRITRGTEVWEIEPKTMAVLVALLASPGAVISSEELIASIWQGRPMGENPVYRAISKLRRIFGEGPGRTIIETVPRKGYRIVLPAHRHTPALHSPKSAPMLWRYCNRVLLGSLAAASIAAVSMTSLRDDYGAHAARDIATLQVAGDKSQLLQLEQLAHTEVHDRQPGFPGRLKNLAEEMLSLSPDFVPGFIARAIGCTFTYYKDAGTADAPGDLRCAREASNEALKRAPERAEVQAAVGLTELAQSQACRENCGADPHLIAAQLHLEHAEWLDAQSPDVHNWLATVYEEMGLPMLEATQVEAAALLDPSNPIINVNYATNLAEQGRSGEARERLLHFVDRPGAPPQVAVALAKLAADRCEPSEVDRWGKRLGAYPNWHGAELMASAELLARCGHREEARRVAARLDPVSPIDSEADLNNRLRLFVAIADQDSLRRFGEDLARELPPAAAAHIKHDRERRQLAAMALAFSGRRELALQLLESVYGVPAVLNSRDNVAWEIDSLNTLTWLYRERAEPAKAAGSAAVALDAMTWLAHQGLDRDLMGQIRAALTEELAGRHDLAVKRVERTAVGGARPDSWLAGDPRWREALTAQLHR